VPRNAKESWTSSSGSSTIHEGARFDPAPVNGGRRGVTEPLVRGVPRLSSRRRSSLAARVQVSPGDGRRILKVTRSSAWAGGAVISSAGCRAMQTCVVHALVLCGSRVVLIRGQPKIPFQRTSKAGTRRQVHLRGLPVHAAFPALLQIVSGGKRRTSRVLRKPLLAQSRLDVLKAAPPSMPTASDSRWALESARAAGLRTVVRHGCCRAIWVPCFRSEANSGQDKFPLCRR